MPLRKRLSPAVLLVLGAACADSGAPAPAPLAGAASEPGPIVHAAAGPTTEPTGRIAVELAPVLSGAEVPGPGDAGRGTGPGGRLYAVDTGGRLVTVFSTEGGELERESEFRLPMEARDLCMLGERIFLMRLDAGQQRVLHEIDAGGRLLRSFGGAHSADESLENWRAVVSEDLTEGPVACSEEAGLVVLAGQGGTVRAFSPDGELRWSTALEGFGRTRYGILPNGALARGGDPEARGNHHVSSVAVLAPDRLLIRLVFHPANIQSQDDTRHEARVLSLHDGRELSTIRGLPQVREAAPPRAPGYASLPFPQFLVLPAQPPASP